MISGVASEIINLVLILLNEQFLYVILILLLLTFKLLQTVYDELLIVLLLLFPVLVDEGKAEIGDVDAVQPRFEDVEGFTLRQDH